MHCFGTFLSPSQVHSEQSGVSMERKLPTILPLNKSFAPFSRCSREIVSSLQLVHSFHPGMRNRGFGVATNGMGKRQYSTRRYCAVRSGLRQFRIKTLPRYCEAILCITVGGSTFFTWNEMFKRFITEVLDSHRIHMPIQVFVSRPRRTS